MQEKLDYSALQISIEDFVSEESNLESLLFCQNEIEEIIQLGHSIICPETHIKEFEIDQLEKNGFSIHGVDFNCGRKIAFQLKNTEKLALFLCTVGKGVTDYYKIFTEQNEPLKAYYVDMLGSISVEKSMNIFQEQFKEIMNRLDLNITNRYSPGYCDWPLFEQQKIFGLFEGNTCGISLNSSCLMIPAKSISGVIGIGHSVKFTEHECNLCNLTHCIYRKRQRQVVTLFGATQSGDINE